MTTTATKDMVFQYPYSIEYANDYKGGHDNFAFFAMYEEDVMSKKDGQVNYAGDDARYTRRIDAVKFLLRREHSAQVVPAEVVESLVEWLDGLHLLFESKEEQEQLLAQEPVQCLEGCECDDCMAQQASNQFLALCISNKKTVKMSGEEAHDYFMSIAKAEDERKAAESERAPAVESTPESKEQTRHTPRRSNQMKIYDESLYCQECGTEISIQEDKFLGGLCEGCYEEQAAQVAPVVEQVPASALVERPAEIQTVSFEMGGKQYQTRSSWELLG